MSSIKNIRTAQEDMDRMQMEAIRRVQEMQSRAKNTLNQNIGQQNDKNPVPKNEHKRYEPPKAFNIPINDVSGNMPNNPNVTSQRKTNNTTNKKYMKLQKRNAFSDLFGILTSDPERNLIMILILILVSEKADTGVIFALMYLIM